MLSADDVEFQNITKSSENKSIISMKVHTSVVIILHDWV